MGPPQKRTGGATFSRTYVVEVDGIAKAEYPIFVKALKAGLQLRQELPNCRVKLRDDGDETTH
jgi:hypothetical protein